MSDGDWSTDRTRDTDRAPNRLSRREFLRGASATGVTAAFGVPLSAVLAAHGASREGSSGGQASKPISLLVRTDINQAYAMKARAQSWNASHSDQIKLDVQGSGVDPTTKIRAQVASGSVTWDGWMVMVVPWDSARWVSANLIQPVDHYVKASKISGAHKVFPAVIPTIRQTTKFNGKTYAFPGNVGSVTLAGQTKATQAAGLKDLNGLTWDQVYNASVQIKSALPHLTPFDSASSPLTDVWPLIWGMTKDIFTSDHLVDMTSEAALEALAWQKKMVTQGLTPWNHQDSFSNWQKGGTAIISCYDVAATVFQAAFGQNSAINGTNMVKVAGNAEGGTPFWTNSCVVLNKCNNPQGMTDFYLWLFGPNNKESGKQMTTVAAKPCYQYTYDEFVKGSPTYDWEQTGIDIVAHSVPFPSHTQANTETTVETSYVQQVLDPSKNADPKSTMQAAMKAVRRQIKSQGY